MKLFKLVHRNCYYVLIVSVRTQFEKQLYLTTVKYMTITNKLFQLNFNMFYEYNQHDNN